MQHLLDILFAEFRAASRYRWHGVAAACVAAVLGWTAVLFVPDKFESRAQIYVDSNGILRPLLQGIAVSPSSESEANVVRRAMLSRPAIASVAEVTGLAKRAKTPQEVDQLLTKLGVDISITGDSKLGFYVIAYADRSPVMAQRVVQSLLDTFVSGATRADQASTRNAQRFLQQQVQEYSSRLGESEQKLAEFKQQHVGLMPDQRGDYFARLQNEQTTHERLVTDLAVATRQRDELRSKITTDSGGSGGAVRDLPTPQQIQTATSLDEQLQQSRRRLDELLLKFTDKHPDVVALRETIARLEARRRTETGGVRATAAPSTSSGASGGDSVLQSIQIALNNADVQMAALQTQVEASNRRIADFQHALTTGPQVEAELAQLNRDYGVTKSQYEALFQRLESANISGKAGEDGDMNFRVLEAPVVPIAPSAPHRFALLVTVLVLSIVIGFAIAFGMHRSAPVFSSLADLEAFSDIPVIGQVRFWPGTVAQAAIRADRRHMALIGAALIVAFVVISLNRDVAGHALRALIGSSGQ